MQKRKNKSCERANLDVNHLALLRHEASILTDVAQAMVLESHLVTQDLNHRNHGENNFCYTIRTTKIWNNLLSHITNIGYS